MACLALFWWNETVRLRLLWAENIQMTKEVEKFQLLKMEAERALEQVSGEFDLIFLDPPYAKEQIVADIEKMDEKELFFERCHGRV